MTDQERNDMLFVSDILKGEINRMCVTHNLSELDTMAMYAKKHIEQIQKMRFNSDFAESEEPYKDWYDVPSDEMTLEQAQQAVKYLRKKLADHLEQEPFMNKPCVAHQVCREDKVKVLDKIRAEIEQNAYPIVHGVNNHELGMTLYGILQIIDKYNAESEEQ